MALSLKERMQAQSLKKEQKRAERMSEVTLKSGPEICAKLAAGRQVNRFGLEQMREAVRLFRDGGRKLDDALAQMSPKKRMMFRVAKEELQGEWMGMFEQLVASIPDNRRDRPFAINWDQWVSLGAEAGMNEEQVVNALRVMLVFRNR